MALSRLQRQWRHAAQRFALHVKTPFKLQLADGIRVVADVLLEGYGAPQGMLIFSHYAAVKDKTDAVVAAGYGYSCMSHPSEAEIQSLEGIQDALADWGRDTDS